MGLRFILETMKPTEAEMMINALNFRAIMVTASSRDDINDKHSVIIRAPFTIKELREVLNNQIFAFDGLEIDELTLNEEALRNHDQIIGLYPKYRYYKSTEESIPRFTLTKLELYFYLMKPLGKNKIAIYAMPDDSVLQFKQRISSRDKIPLRSLQVQFEGKAIEEFKDYLDDRGVMHENFIADYGIVPGVTVDCNVTYNITE